MDAKQLKDLVIVPVLDCLGLNSPSAINLLLGTCAQESNMGKNLIQQPNGPARGIYQMEPATHHNLLAWLSSREELNNKVNQLVTQQNIYKDRLDELVFNLAYATAMARIRYLAWNSEPLPAADDIPALASYYKKYYNTSAGAANEQKFIDNYHRYILGA